MVVSDLLITPPSRDRTISMLPTTFMIGNGIATQFEKPNKQFYLDYVSATDSVFHASGYLKHILNTMDPPPINGEYSTWEKV